MTISSTNRKAGPFIGNGTASAFPFTFKVFQALDLEVVRLDQSTNTETVLAYISDYTVTLNQDQDSNPGGTVTLVGGALATGYTLTMTSDVPNLQPTDLTNQGGFYPEVINDALDRATIQIQQLQEQTDRSLKVALSSNINATLPPPSPNDLIGWNAAGDSLQNVNPGSIATLVAYATAYCDVFVGDGITTSWTLTRNPAVLYNLDVSINGSTQEPTRDYTLSGTTFTMTSPPPLGARVVVKYKEGLPNFNGDSQDVRFVAGGVGAVQRTSQSKMRDWVSVLDFGADPTGGTDSRAACQNAINAVRTAGGGTVYFPAGVYLINGVTSSDSTLNGLLIPYLNPNGTDGRVRLLGSGRSTKLLAGSNNMYVIRFSDNHGGVENFSILSNGKTGVIGLGVVPESTTQTTSLTFQTFNVFQNLYINGCAEGIVLECGPDVGGADSGCWYNAFTDMHIYYCTRGIWLKDCPAGSSGSNRNYFSRIRIGQGTNTGVQIDDGGTNVFEQVHIEGVVTGTSPNTVPSAMIIKQTGASGADNNSNVLIGCMWEANTRGLVNDNGYTELHGCEIGPWASQVWTTRPFFVVGSAYLPTIINQLSGYQRNGEITGWGNLTWNTSGIQLDGRDIFGAGFGEANDKNYGWQTFAITTSNTANVATISEYQSKFKSFGQMVDWHCRFQFNATVGTDPIKVELPVDPDSDLYRLYSSIGPIKQVIVTGNGVTEGAGILKFSSHIETLNGKAYVWLYPHSSPWNTGGNNNFVNFMLRYRKA